MDFESSYEISATAEFIYSRNFTRVALQFPDSLLKDSTRVVATLRKCLQSLREIDERYVGLYVMADTTYGNCCVDEVGASHINADCVIHYGQTCFSPTTTLPSFFVFGKASISIDNCVESISESVVSYGKPIMVLFGLEYAHSIPQIQKVLLEASISSKSELKSEVHFADIPSSVMFPSKHIKNLNGLQEPSNGFAHNSSFYEASGTSYSIGGLTWKLPEGQQMDDYLIFWIGVDNSAFANAVLTFNACEIVRYDATENRVLTDLAQQRKILNHRYYLVERAKDANIVGILVGTLGVAGYLHTIDQMKELITRAGKKAYTMVMGRPNPAKLANFTECDVFINVSCPQTALLDSKAYLAPVITPFEATIAFSRGSQWTGAYITEFQNLIDLPQVEVESKEGEARFSFFHGGYVENIDIQEEEDREALALVNATEKALQLQSNRNSLIKVDARSGAEFFATRSFQGLDIDNQNLSPEPYLLGKKGRAAGYEDEKRRFETS